MMEAMQDDLMKVLNKLAKWRSFFASWQLGTRLMSDPECAAIRDHREATLMLRVEVTALAGLLMDKGVISRKEWMQAMADEAMKLDEDLEKTFSGFSTSSSGLHMKMPAASDTMKRMNFRP